MARAELMGQGLSHFSIPGIWGCLGLVKDGFCFFVLCLVLFVFIFSFCCPAFKNFEYSQMSFLKVGYMPK